MGSDLFKLQINDFWKGAVVAVLAALFTYLASVLNAPGFEWETLNYSEIFKIALASFMAYISKNFVSDSEGRIGGVI